MLRKESSSEEKCFYDYMETVTMEQFRKKYEEP